MKTLKRDTFMIKLALVTCSVLIGFSTNANDPLESFLTAPMGSGFASGANNNGSTPQQGGFRDAQNRSTNFKRCETLAGMQWTEAFAAPYFQNKKVMDKFIKPAFDKRANGVNATRVSPEELAAKIVHQVLLCEAYRVSTDPANYDYNQNYGEFEGDDGKEAATSMFGASGIECANQPTAQAKTECMVRAKEEGPLSCSHNGAETHDFLQCKKVINFMDGFVAGKQVMQVQQTVRAGLKQNDLQDGLMQKQISGEGVGIVDSMGAQAESIEQQGNLAYEMAAFDAAKAGTLLTMINNFPKPSTMIEECNNQMAQYGDVSQIVHYIQKALGSHKIGPTETKDHFRNAVDNIPTQTLADYCTFAISTNRNAGGGQNFLFMNQKIIDKVKSAAMKAGLEALANGAKGALLHDQAGLIEDAMKDIEEFAPPEFPVAEPLPDTASECLVDPEAEGCIAPTTAGFEGFRDGGFNANIGGSASLGTPGQNGNLSDEGSSVSGATNRDLLPENFGLVDAQPTGPNDFVDGTAAPGSIKAGQVAAGGGGAGAGAGGGGGGFGGGGGARGPAAKEKPSGKRDINIKTKGSGFGAIGGTGRIGANKRKPNNPFSKLLGKNKAKGNGTLNFRGPAQVGGKKGSIFQMISNRYSNVAKKDRLLKYEIKK